MWKILKYFMGAVFLVTAVLAGYNHFTKPLSVQERVTATNEWVSGLGDVYNKTHDPELLQRIERLENHATRAVPDGNGFNVEKQPSEGDYFLIPLGGGDTTSTPWKELYQMRDYATTWFTTGNKNIPLTFVVIKNGENLSSETKGVLLAHELDHEKTGPAKNLCEDEVIHHTFSNRLWLELGGEPYQKLLDERAKEYGAYFLDQKSKITPASRHIDELDKIFGKSISSGERIVRAFSLDYASMFLAVDKYYPGMDKTAEKAKLYCSVNSDDARANKPGIYHK